MSKIVYQDIHTKLHPDNPFSTSLVVDRFVHLWLTPEKFESSYFTLLAVLDRRDAEKLAQMLLETIGKVPLLWSVDDVIELAKYKTGGHLIDRQEAMEILKCFRDNHEKEFGADLETLHAEIETRIGSIFEEEDHRQKINNFVWTAYVAPAGINQRYGHWTSYPWTTEQYGIFYREFNGKKHLLWAVFHSQQEAESRLREIKEGTA
jgi:hypothetical protein